MIDSANPLAGLLQTTALLPRGPRQGAPQPTRRSARLRAGSELLELGNLVGADQNQRPPSLPCLALSSSKPPAASGGRELTPHTTRSLAEAEDWRSNAAGRAMRPIFRVTTTPIGANWPPLPLFRAHRIRRRFRGPRCWDSLRRSCLATAPYVLARKREIAPIARLQIDVTLFSALAMALRIGRE